MLHKIIAYLGNQLLKKLFYLWNDFSIGVEYINGYEL